MDAGRKRRCTSGNPALAGVGVPSSLNAWNAQVQEKNWGWWTMGPQMAMGQNPNRTPSKHPNPRLKWVVHLPQNGTMASNFFLSGTLVHFFLGGETFMVIPTMM